MIKITRIQQMLNHLREFGPLTGSQIEDAGFFWTSSRRRLLDCGAIEIFKGASLESAEKWARVTATYYRVGKNEYLPRRKTKGESE